MQEKELKTSGMQRFWIIFIAVVMLGSVVVSYVATIVLNGRSSGSSTPKIDESKLQEYTAAYSEAQDHVKEVTKKDYKEFIKFKSKIVAYNEAAANGINVQKEDLKKGTGRKITDDDKDYYAYYVGWCADESKFDSSFDSNTDPTGFVKFIDASAGMIEGWDLGVNGMRLDGIRIITIPGSLAYGETREICGGYDKPLKFMVMLKEKTEALTEAYMVLEDAALRLQYAQYGLDYDEIIKSETGE